jgi:hypothetical protein
MGAGGATGCGVGTATGAGIRAARSFSKSLSKTDFALIYSKLAMVSVLMSERPGCCAYNFALDLVQRKVILG